jgi:hypothetical protein
MWSREEGTAVQYSYVDPTMSVVRYYRRGVMDTKNEYSNVVVVMVASQVQLFDQTAQTYTRWKEIETGGRVVSHPATANVYLVGGRNGYIYSSVSNTFTTVVTNFEYGWVSDMSLMEGTANVLVCGTSMLGERVEAIYDG